MPNLDYRALVKRRRTEARATTALHRYCLDIDLVVELEALIERRNSIIADLEKQRTELLAEGEGRRAKPSTAAIDAEIKSATEELDAEIDSLRKKIDEMTVTLRFNAVPEGLYSKLAAETDEDDSQSVRKFMNALAEAGWAGASKDGDEVDLGPFDEVWDSLTFGETDVIRAKVFQANLRVVDIPF